MSLYTPVFPAMPAPKRAASQSSLSSSLAGSSRQPQVSISNRLRDQHLALASVPAILSPPSPAPEPNSGAIEELIQEIHSAVEAANWHPSSGKWAHVHSLAKLSCSEGCYWSGLGRRVPSRTDDGFELFLADTEEEYAEWETRQEARRQEAKRRSEEAAEREMEQQLAQGLNPKTQAAAVAKVMQWQADFVPESQPVGAESQNTKQRTLAVSPPPALPANQLSPVAGPSKGKEKEKAPIANSRFFPPPAPLQHPEPESTALAPKLPAPAPAQDTLQAMSISPEEIAAPRPAPASGGPRISQVSESYIPPSFEGVVTSTPQPEKVTLKLRPPAIPIVPGLLFPSIVEPEPFAPSQAAHPDPVPGPSSPPVKRPYTAASPIEDSFELDVYASAKPTKKVRTPPPLAPEPIARPSIVPVSSPPRTSIPPLSQCSSASTPPGLGNIHDLPPVTPDRRGVLATSQRSQPLPRPLSRRQSVAEGLEDDTDKRPARTYFSSPASRSSNGSPAAAPTSPVSPLFTQDKARPGSQHPDLGYNSQVDVEARIENISAILENDVDFDQWLRQSANPENPS